MPKNTYYLRKFVKFGKIVTTKISLDEEVTMKVETLLK